MTAIDSKLINSETLLTAFLAGLLTHDEQGPDLYVDLEGENLCRHGTLALITMYVVAQQTVYLIDVTTLGHKAFDTAGSSGTTLRHVLEAADITKVFFDIRNDSDALFSLYGVRVAGIEDIQLMELASRGFSKKCVHGLAKCIENTPTVGYSQQRQWRKVKEEGRGLFDPARGGSFAVFAERPLSAKVQEYCVQDVTLMPLLREVYCAKLCDAWWWKIGAETSARIRLSQTPGFNGKGRHMALGPGD